MVYYRSISEETLMIAVLGDQDKTIDADDVESAIDEGNQFMSGSICSHLK